MTSYNDHYVLKVTGEHGLVFKTKHSSKAYLEKVAQALLAQKDTHFTHYEIHSSDHSNAELTENEQPIHFSKLD
jgi:hypothetical protein